MSGVLSVFFVFFLVLCFFVLNTNARGVIAVLQKASKLQQLETRNKHLNEMFYKEGQDPGFDIVIFCEHYVKTIYQEKLQNSSKLPLIFVFVDSSLRGSEKVYMSRLKNRTTHQYMQRICPVNGGSNYFSFGYKGMCQFWFTDFQEYVKDYDWLLRVDDDCHLLKLKNSSHDLSSLFPLPDHIPLAATMWAESVYCSDQSTVTGLRDFTQDFVLRHNITEPTGELRNLSSHAYFRGNAEGGKDCFILSPYTNVFYLNLKWLREKAIVQTYMQEVKSTGCIFNNRWGDLDLWGSIQLILDSPIYYYIPLPYFHGSHRCKGDPYFLSHNPKGSSQGHCSVSLHAIRNHFTNTSVNLSFPLVGYADV